MKLLAEQLKKPGVDALSPENPLLFMPGPFSGFPIPSASRTCVVTKSPRTSPLKSKHPKASTVSYANMGGFFGPEVRFAGYDGIVVTGRAAEARLPLYRRRQGRGPRRLEVLGDGDGRVRPAVHRGPRRPAFPDLLHRPGRREPGLLRVHPQHRGPGRRARRGRLRHGFEESEGGSPFAAAGSPASPTTRGSCPCSTTSGRTFRDGFAEGLGSTTGAVTERRAALIAASENGVMAVKNYSQGTFDDVDKISGVAAETEDLGPRFRLLLLSAELQEGGGRPERHVRRPRPRRPGVRDGRHDGLQPDDQRPRRPDEGHLRRRRLRPRPDLDRQRHRLPDGGLREEAHRQGLPGRDRPHLGERGRRPRAWSARSPFARASATSPSQGVKALAARIGGGSERFAIHCKGHELAAWDPHRTMDLALSYATASRGACHLNSGTARGQNDYAATDSLGVCLFATDGFGKDGLRRLLSAITGTDWTEAEYLKAGERIYNLERAFNCREGFVAGGRHASRPLLRRPARRRGPGRAPSSSGTSSRRSSTEYYRDRSWDEKTGRPKPAKLKSLGLETLI